MRECQQALRRDPGAGRRSFSVGAGEIHALLGENGAGKSTLVKILSGLTRPDSGTISVFGAAVDIARHGARAAHALGMRTAFQEISLVPDLTIADNLLLPEAPTPLSVSCSTAGGRPNGWMEFSTRLELHDLDPRIDVRDCPLPIRQKLEIASAIAREPRILLLDEPTSALSAATSNGSRRRIAGAARAGTDHRPHHASRCRRSAASATG